MFRTDIQILRCIAIVLVVLFHCKLSLFKAGYIGVDIFLVISGYLMHQIVNRRLSRGEFSFSAFLVRRILRLYPAYSLFLIAITIYASRQLNYFEYDTFSNMLQSAVMQTVNIYLFNNTGYFDAGSGNNYLLHLWSISLEWQFYLIFPFILYCAFYKKVSTLKVLACVFLCSFLLSLYSFVDSKMAFYLLPFRIWEFVLGAIVAESNVASRLSRQKTKSSLPYYTGFALIAIPVVVYPHIDTGSFPGLLALPPVLGTAMLLAAGKDRSPQWTRGKFMLPLVWIGNLSYSIYLYHWPIVVHFEKGNASPSSLQNMFYVLLLTVVVSIFSYYLVENAFRKIKTRAVAVSSCAVAISCLALALCCQLRTSLASRLNEKQIHYQSFARDTGGLVGKDLLGAQDVAPTFLLFGDSHANVLMKVFDDISNQRHVSGLAMNTRHPLFGCARRIDYNLNPKEHLGDQENIVNLIKKYSIKNVIISARWSWYINGYLPHETDVKSAGRHEMICLDDGNVVKDDAAFRYGVETTLSALQNIGVENIWIVLPVPEQHFDVPSQLASQNPSALQLVSTEEYKKRNEAVLSIFNDVEKIHFIDIASALKKLGNGMHYPVLVNDTPLYMDDDHMSYHGTLLIKNIFLPFFQSLR